MRRLLAIVLAAAPLVAGAQTTPTMGTVVATPAVINAAQCAVTYTDKSQSLLWFIQLEDSATWPFKTGGEYKFFASNDPHDGTNPFCYTSNVGTTIFAGKIVTDPSPYPATVQAPTTPLTGSPSLLPALAGFDCSANATINVCVLWYPAVGDATPRGFAKGTIQLKISAPGKPTVTAVRSGNEALYVVATTPAGAAPTSEAATEWRAKAVARNLLLDGGTHYSSRVGVVSGVGSEAKISGLINGVDYDVTAYSYSVDDNESPASDSVGPYSPMPAADAWEVYQKNRGRDSGGCQSGAAGLAALAGVAALLRIRRRS
jgi:hypothetical protein